MTVSKHFYNLKNHFEAKMTFSSQRKAIEVLR